MHFSNIIIFILNCFDNYKTKKIYKKLSIKINNNPFIFDVGAHHGESIDLMSDIFKNSIIYSFEISKENFKILNSKKKYLKKRIKLFNFGFSDKRGEFKFLQSKESSSSTLSEININSKYLRRKLNILGRKKKNDFFYKRKCKLNTIDYFFSEKNLKKIDLLKIDTEGHEFKILKGAKKTLKLIKFIYFEHHYDDMILKKYTFSDIHNFLIKNNFKKILKSKMFFRKTFEYVYENQYFN